MNVGTPASEAKVVPANTVYTAKVEVSGGRGGSARSLTGSHGGRQGGPGHRGQAPLGGYEDGRAHGRRHRQ
ncbi:hypothetical protein AB0874_12885, partial [Micromonospora chalcea]